MKVYIAVISHKHGQNVYVGGTPESRLAQVAAYCREWWQNDGPKEPMPDNDEALVDEYFEWSAEIGGSECVDNYDEEVI